MVGVKRCISNEIRRKSKSRTVSPPDKGQFVTSCVPTLSAAEFEGAAPLSAALLALSIWFS